MGRHAGTIVFLQIPIQAPQDQAERKKEEKIFKDNHKAKKDSALILRLSPPQADWADYHWAHHHNLHISEILVLETSYPSYARSGPHLLVYLMSNVAVYRIALATSGLFNSGVLNIPDL